MKRGDVVQLGRHRLMCGDAFSEDDRAALLQGNKPDMLYCDPPYGMNLKTDYGRNAKWASVKGGEKQKPRCKTPGRNYLPVIGDDKDFDATPIIEAFFPCKEQFWWGADYYRQTLPLGGSWVVWDKRLDAGCDAMWGSSFEMCWSRKAHKRDIARVRWVGVLGCESEPGRKRVHPTHKPVLLAEWFLERYSKPDALVLDLFGGSGSTLLACERMGRCGYLMELSPDYCDVIVQRYNALIEKQRLPLFDGVAS